MQRTLKFAKYLRAAGVEPTVLTVEAGAYPKLDPAMAADVPSGVAVLRTPAPDPFALYGRLTGRTRQEAVADQLRSAPAGAAERAARWVRANLVVPDARVGWVPFAVRAARRAHRARPFDAVLTSGPPHSAHLVGRALRRDGLPWVADFRDPWTDIHYYERLPRTRPAQWADARLERAVLHAADRVTVVSGRWRDLLAAKVDRPARAFAVVANGFDAEDFEGVEGRPPTDRFTLTHVGTLYGTPDPVLQALARLRTRGAQTAGAGRLRLRLVGHVPAAVAEAVGRYGLREAVEVVPYVPHDAAVREMAGAGALLLVLEDWPHAEGLVTGKLYEYLASGRPVIGVGPPDGDAAALLAETGGGALVARDDVDGLTAVLGAHYHAWAAGAPLDGARRDRLAPYTRRAQTARLADVIREAVVERRRRGGG
ncbi:glycosyltransferase [Rubrivirga litoralis]|uniref:Glycosyltransferase n=1 Tax=Rubrivirga litoralis TaxID=3075598 RepID=A0ABU3BUJ9_9BACT|nr:glycosyltransferase [Rubrivirga sp. F394]MDT0632973.1 glycosyltransferase [Rubrivirga sp. F394]